MLKWNVLDNLTIWAQALLLTNTYLCLMLCSSPHFSTSKISENVLKILPTEKTGPPSEITIWSGCYFYFTTGYLSWLCIYFTIVANLEWDVRKGKEPLYSNLPKNSLVSRFSYLTFKKQVLSDNLNLLFWDNILSPVSLNYIFYW